MNVPVLAAVAAVALLYYLSSAYFRLYQKRTSDLKIYQDKLYDRAKSFIENEETPDGIAKAARVLFEFSGIKNASLHFISIAHETGDDSDVDWTADIRDASDEMRKALAEMMFDFLMVLKLRSIFFGWLVFPAALNSKGPGRKRLSSWQEVDMNLIKRFKNSTNQTA